MRRLLFACKYVQRNSQLHNLTKNESITVKAKNKIFSIMNIYFQKKLQIKENLKRCYLKRGFPAKIMDFLSYTFPKKQKKIFEMELKDAILTTKGWFKVQRKVQFRIHALKPKIQQI